MWVQVDDPVNETHVNTNCVSAIRFVVSTDSNSKSTCHAVVFTVDDVPWIVSDPETIETLQLLVMNQLKE